MKNFALRSGAVAAVMLPAAAFAQEAPAETSAVTNLKDNAVTLIAEFSGIVGSVGLAALGITAAVAGFVIIKRLIHGAK